MIRAVLLAAAVLGFATAAQAEEPPQYALTSADEEGAVLLDIANLAEVGGYQRAPLTLVFTEPKEDNLTFITMLTEFDCARKQRRVVSMAFFDDRQTSLGKSDGTGWDPVLAETREGAVFKVVCQAGKPIREMDTTDLPAIRSWIQRLAAEQDDA